MTVNAEWRYTCINEGAAIMPNRWHPEGLIGKHIWMGYPEGVGRPFQLACQRAMREQVPVTLGDLYTPWDRWFENHIYASPEGLTIYFTEITGRKRAQGELRTHREHLEDLAAERTTESTRMADLTAGRKAHTTGLQDTIHQRDAQPEVAGLTFVANDPSATEGGGVT